MTWAEFNAEVLTFLDVDARRRGIEAFRTSYLKAGLADLENYVPDVKGDYRSYVDADQTPYDSEVAEAVAEYLKSKIARNVDRDLQLSQSHLTSYALLRRRLYIRGHEEESMELRPHVGKLYVVTLDLRAGRLPLVIGPTSNVWFTVKRRQLDGDACALVAVQRGTGIEIINAATSRIRVTLTAEQTAMLSGPDSDWEVQVQDPDGTPVFPLRGKIRPIIPLTRDYEGVYTPPAPVVLVAGGVSFHESANAGGVTTIAPPATSGAHQEITTISGIADGRVFVLVPQVLAWGTTQAGVTLRHRVIMPALAGITLEWRNGTVGGALLTSFISSDSGDDLVADFLYDGAAYRFVSFIAPANA